MHDYGIYECAKGYSKNGLSHVQARLNIMDYFHAFIILFFWFALTLVQGSKRVANDREGLGAIIT